MKLITLGLALAAVALSPPGCRNPFSGQSVILGVSNLEAPSATLPGAAVTVVLTVGVNGCERFSHVSQMRLKSQIVLTAVGTNAALGRKDMLCPAVFSSAQHTVVIEEPPPAPFAVIVRQPREGTPLRADIAIGPVTQ